MIKVNDVFLPNWASSPEEFIFRSRQVLESPYASGKLSKWIDLIFGCRQKDEENLFFPLTYEGSIDLEEMRESDDFEGLLMQINNFGQTPFQLFGSFHPSKKRIDSNFPHQNIVEFLISVILTIFNF